VRLGATDGTKISIDYSVYSDPNFDDAKPVWVNVTRDNFTGSEGVHVVMIEKILENGQEKEGRIDKIDLTTFVGNEKRYTGELRQGLSLRKQNVQIVGHEFAFSVGQDWLKDPVSGNSNFKANLLDINRANNFICRNPTSTAPAPAGSNVSDWRQLPDQAEIDQLTSKPINDPAHPYTDYRPGAPGANMDLPGQKILDAMNKSADRYKTRKNDQNWSYLTGCLQTGYQPTHWPDIAIHYYCVMNEPRYCYTYATSGSISRVNSFKGCIGQWPGPGAFPHESYRRDFEWVRDTQPREFQYVMFAQTNAFKADQEQAIINKFWGVNDPYNTNECNDKRPRRQEDPTDGTHCRPNKVFRTQLVGRSR
jgi:hypothetical protein